MKHLVANKPKVLPKDREKIRSLEDKLQEIRLKGHVLSTAVVNIWVKFVKLTNIAQCMDFRNASCI